MNKYIEVLVGKNSAFYLPASILVMQQTQHESSSVLREQILDLSKRYIKALAEENKNVVDGPYVGTVTAYDLKKTLAVLLDNILQRIGKLESKVENLVLNGTGANSTNNTTTSAPSLGAAEKLNVADLINGAQEQCELPPMDGFPHCEGKIKVENWCPRLPWRAKNPNEETDQKTVAEIRINFDNLYKMMSRHEEFRWMMLRIRRMADTWIEAIKSLAEKQNLEKRKRKKLLPQLVKTKPKVANMTTDFLSCLVIPGASASGSSPMCMLRVLDSFGTEPEFNHAHYAQSKGHKTPWGKWNLNPQQFYTMFPHTPDNSFLGFVVEQHLNSSDIKHINDIKRQNQSLVYGKVDNFWKDKKAYLDVIHTYMEVHGTVHGTSTMYIPGYVKNHGILSGRDLQFLLRETKLFVGLGFPYEGPAPLEAIANGCAFLNLRFNPPKSSKNTDFFKGKPTLRELTSQHPYAEVYIGKPHVWTVDINDLSEVEKAVKSILNQKHLNKDKALLRLPDQAHFVANTNLITIGKAENPTNRSSFVTTERKGGN
ncbi:hypothetical protein IHE44_0014622 [Lamprotornis superbus]|uniref:alpha-1,6-mannosyl-glycoprotein 6-beta-N-acetylglucosaminyltransferase n=1 Tax=Lamprotornis superbus TaxID=245042 RepID=A0A835U056_9PASS|nr:hypothetical protein IHE44_0014622 [Lamprotornis superbus]